MLSYRHSFHAGNHADVLKHIVLSLCLSSLNEKEKPYLYLDTHSGAGRYLLRSEHAQKTAEYKTGIERLWKCEDIPANIQKILAPYLTVLRYFNREVELKYYPGSPLIAKHILREDDKLNLSELHNTDFQLLRHEFLKDKRAHVLRGDGYQQLKAQLPPLMRRGMILVDPSYEIKEDYQAAAKAILEGYKRFATGVYALWYPVVSRTQTQRMINILTESGVRRILQIELAVKPDNTQKGMTASGMIVINPPWQLAAQMQDVLPWLHKTLVPEGFGGFTVKELVPE